MTIAGYYTKYKKSDKSVYLISVLNLATELQSSVYICKITITTPPQRHLGRAPFHFTWQRMHSPALFATSCAMCTADKFNHSHSAVLPQYTFRTDRHTRPI